jgi:putative colanic acid biosynthesis acetyltransferase WcaF
MTILNAKENQTILGGATFSLSNRLERALWSVTWLLLARWTPIPAFGWRRFLVRLFGGRIDPTAKIYPSVAIWYPRNLEMAAYTCLGKDVDCYNMAPIRLDAFSLVSQGAHLCAGTHDVDDDHFQLVAKPIAIGNKAWVAAEAFVGPGVTIGDGAVLGARAVTVKSLQPMMIYAGNPARPLRERKISKIEPSPHP